MAKVTCETCGAVNEVRPCVAKRGAKYCSRPCYHESQKRRVQVQCSTCAKPFITSPVRRLRGHGKYCSRQCCADAKKKGDAVKRNYAYASWRGMVKRCFDKNSANYKHYGGRGITVCKRWRGSFEAFLEDMGPRPYGNTLDRIDVNKGYSPENCRWASPLTQARNRRNTAMVTYLDQEMSLSEFADLRGIRYPSLFRRVKGGQEPVAAANDLIALGCTI